MKLALKSDWLNTLVCVTTQTLVDLGHVYYQSLLSSLANAGFDWLSNDYSGLALIDHKAQWNGWFPFWTGNSGRFGLRQADNSKSSYPEELA